MSTNPQLSPQQALVVSFKQDITNIRGYLQKLIPWEGGVDAFETATLLAGRRNMDLLKANRNSLILAILWCVQKGLEPGVDDGCWLVPFAGVVTPVPAYKGLIKKAIETETVIDVQPFPIYAADEFDYAFGLSPFLIHKPPKLGTARGALIGAYVVFTMPDGSKRFAPPMDRPQIEKIRNVSAAYKHDKTKGPWVEWEEAMFLKTVIKQGFKYIPVKASLRDLLTDDNRLETGSATVGTLLLEGEVELPDGVDPNVTGATAKKEKEPVDTSAYDKLVAAQNFTPERLALFQRFELEMAPKVGSMEKMKLAAAKHFAGADKMVGDRPFKSFMTVFGEWEAKQTQGAAAVGQGTTQAGAGAAKEETQGKDQGAEPEPPGGGSGEAPGGAWGVEETAQEPGKVESLTERVEAIWRVVVEKGIPLAEMAAKVQVTQPSQVTAENIAAVEDMVKNYQPPRRGKAK